MIVRGWGHLGSHWRFIILALAAVSVTLSAGCEDQTTVRVIAKLDPHPWFDRVETGIDTAADELDVNATMVGPVDATVEGQIALIDEAIAEGVDVIAVIPNDVLDIDPALQRARDEGIIVLSHESPDQPSADWDVETIDNELFAEAVMDSLGNLIGGTGQVGHFVGGADLHNVWNRTAQRYAETTWGTDIEFVSIEAGGGPTPCAEVPEDCAAATATLLAMYPNLAGILTFGSQGAIGAGQHLMSVNNTDVAVVGVAVPSQGADLIREGWIDRGFLWDPADAGYAVVAVADLLARGSDPEAGLTIGNGLGTATVNLDVRDIFFNRVLEITPDNVDTFDF